MPPTPGWTALASNHDAFMRWLQAQLRAGFSPSREVIVNARKVGRGVRPVAVWSLADRVVYRALVDFILRNEQELDRSPEAYGQFVGEPIKHARRIDLAKRREGISGPPPSKLVVVFSVKSSTFTHVVKSDITAFYQYIDHQILFDELLAKTGDYDAISALIQLLDETQGRRFGLPQLLAPSDRLSEVYIDIVHRSVRRQGFPIWRFSDDFRILCASYEEALSAIEALAEASREAGLVISEHKTTAPTFETYVFEVFGLRPDEAIPEELDPTIPINAADYTELDDDDGSDALAILASMKEPPGSKRKRKRSTNSLTLDELTFDEIRRLRRAVRQLTRLADPRGLAHLVKLMRFVPASTPDICRYLLAVASPVVVKNSEDPGVAEASAGSSDPTISLEVAQTIDWLTTKLSLNSWQEMWILFVVRQLALLENLSGGNVDKRIDWVKERRSNRRSAAVRAEAILVLGDSGRISASDIDMALLAEPNVMSPWYTSAAVRLQSKLSADEANQLNASLASHPMYCWLAREAKIKDANA
jgi:hypothetical protein